MATDNDTFTRMLRSILLSIIFVGAANGLLPSSPSTLNVRPRTRLFLAGGPNRQNIFEGMDLFRKGDIQGSIDKFDASVPPGSSAYLWQRGISYYYNDDFANGSKQFRDDVLQSPLDVEEIVWDAACLLRMDPETFPPKNVMSLPKGKSDRRPIMSIVYKLFRGEATEHDLADAGHKGGPSEEFYSLLYLGLFCEARGELSKAESYMRSAAKTKYAEVVGSRDYMVDVVKVHCSLRHWT